MTKKQSLRQQYRDTLKSSDTEEWFDLIFYRPIGFMWACLAKKLHVSPNAITIASIFLGLGAGICFYFPNIWINVLGVILLVWANSFDSADGQLARMTQQYSRLGRILDGLSGDVWFAAIYIAICLRENATSDFFASHMWLIWCIGGITGLCHGVQAAMADYYRQFHLYFLKGEAGSELDNASDLKERLKDLSWSKNFFQKLTLIFYTNYTVGQEKRTPWMQRLRKELSSRYGQHIPESFRNAFRTASLPLMKFTNILSFNTRCFALFIAILAFRQPWLYFAFELTILNILMIYMMMRHERLCRKFVNSLKTNQI